MIGTSAPAAAGGLAAAQARVAAIQGRIETLMPAQGFGSALQASQQAGSGGGVQGAQADTGTPGLTAAGAPARGAGGPAGGAWMQRLPEAGRPWADAIAQAADEAGVDPALLAALVKHESGFRPGVVSHAGAIGLAQLMPGTAAGLGVDPNDPMDNLRGGARYLKQQLDRVGSPELALAAYNAGPNRVAQAGGIPRISETQTYVGRVMSTWEQWR